MLNDTFFSPLLSSTLAGSHSQVGLKLSENTLKWISYFVFSPNFFLWWIRFELDSFWNFWSFFINFCFFFLHFSQNWWFLKDWNGIPGSITRNFFLCLFVENVVYFVSWTNAKWKTQKKLQLWIDKFILEIDEKPIMLKKIINILVSFQNNEQPYLCKLIQVLLLQYLITFMAQLNSLYCVYNRLHCCCFK